jgi:hypothetical protein
MVLLPVEAWLARCRSVMCSHADLTDLLLLLRVHAVLIVFGATGAVGHALLQCVMKDTHLGKDIKVGSVALRRQLVVP